MANKKFSAFTSQTELSNFDGLVGFESTEAPFNSPTDDNYYITVTNLYNDLQENLNLSNFNVGVLPAERGGTGVAGAAGQKVWSAVQQFVWTDGSPISYTNISNNTGVYLPFDTTATIDVSTNTSLGNKWTAVNSATGGTGGLSQQCTFTLGVNG